MESESVISVDTMSGDRGVKAAIGGLHRCLKQDSSLRFILHGDEPVIRKLLHRRSLLSRRSRICHAEESVPMHQKPVDALRTGRSTSMWRALGSVAEGEASAVVSSGNTGALMAMSLVRLRKEHDVSRPALAVLWPSRSRAGFNVVLDVGAGVDASARNLCEFALMGVEYARTALAHPRPRVGLLNIGTEQGKGYRALHSAADALADLARDPRAAFDYIGYVEGDAIPENRVDVVVTDGFTGNIALKSAEGTARLIREGLASALRQSLLSRLGGMLAFRALYGFNKKIDPRRVNGGVFLGLNGLVVKSHGRADAVGFATAVRLAARMAQSGFSSRIARQLRRVNELPSLRQEYAGNAETPGVARQGMAS